MRNTSEEGASLTTTENLLTVIKRFQTTGVSLVSFFGQSKMFISSSHKKANQVRLKLDNQ